jgi:hemoglobin
MSDPPDQNWSLSEELGGQERLRAIVHDFYSQVFEDAMIGFFFVDNDLEHLVDMQVAYLRARLGNEEADYGGESIRAAHRDLPILPAHFDRRHELLVETLEDWDVPEHVYDAWVDLEQRLRDLVVRTGDQRRREILEGDDADET